MSDAFNSRVRSSDNGLALRVITLTACIFGCVVLYTVLNDGARADTNNSAAVPKTRAVVQAPTIVGVSMSQYAALAEKVSALEDRASALEGENHFLREELSALTGQGGAIELLIGHVRRIDGQGQALRIELSDALSGSYGEVDSVSALAPSARHQLVTRDEGAAPSVTPRMSDSIVPTMRPVEAPPEEGEID